MSPGCEKYDLKTCQAEIFDTLVALVVMKDSRPFKTVAMSCSVCGSTEVESGKEALDEDDGGDVLEAKNEAALVVDETFEGADRGKVEGV